MMLERFSQPIVDPLALLSNVSTLQHYSPSPSASSSTQVPQPLADSSGQDNAFYDDVDEQPVQDLALNVDNVFLADDCDAFDSDVDEAPTAQTMSMANLSSADPVTNEAGPSYDSDILSEVPDHEHYQDAACTHHKGHVTHDSVQLDHVVDSYADYTSDSNMILYDQYVKDNEVQVIHSDASSVPIDAFMMIYNDMCESHDQSVSNPSRNTVVKNSITAELAIYKEHVELKKMNAKMNDPECVTRKVKIAPHDYLKENFLATFTPQKQLTPEQIFWPNDLMKLKSKALKERTKVSRLIKALTVYPPNTPATLVPKVLPTKSQLKIHIFTLIQLFLEFDKTCKKRITPTGLTEGERGFEQTKECYLKEVISFFKTLKDNFEGIQKALTKEIKEMKDVFKELEAKFAQYAVDRKHDATERKSLLITNDNLIAECLSQGVFSVATNSELNVARFTEMHVANTTVEARVNSYLNASRSQPKSHVKPNRISPTKGVNKLPVEDQPRTNKYHLRTSNRVDYSSRLKRTVVQVVIWYLDSSCSKHITGDRSRLMNFVKKSIGTVRFGNDHFGAIMGYGDYVISNSVISRTVPKFPQQNDVVERRNRTLVEAARTMLIFSKAPMFLWAEAVATASKILESFNQQLILEYLLGMHQAGKGIESTTKEPGPAPNFLTPGPISSGLVPNLVPATPYAPPINKELEILFQPMFDEYLEPPRAERPVPPAQAEQAPVNSAGTPSSTTIDQDAPTPIISPSSSALQSHSLHQG
nr:putative ribonuclease H-like domain-containing protein [Tanacetum cinerariifolium]